MKKVIVTGYKGFIGSHLTSSLLASNYPIYSIYGIDKDNYCSNDYHDSSNFTKVKEDIKDITFLPDCDIIFNLAAESHVDNSINSSDLFFNSNLLGVKNLLELIHSKPCFKANPPLFVHFSTDEVYGDTMYGKHSETSILKPSNPYAASKASADLLIESWARTFGLKYIIVRPTNNYGIRQYIEKLIPLAIECLKRDKKIPLHNNGTPVRTWLHVEDCVEAVLYIINNNLPINTIYNISSNFELSNNEVVTRIIKNIKNTDCIEKFVDYNYNRPGQDMRYSLNDDKLRSYGWEEKKDFDTELLRICNINKLQEVW